MFSVLIVEDEMFVRLGIKNSINWTKYNMAVLDDVSDGQLAWESYCKNKPDILLTDLRMPNMDGMELISKIRAVDKKIRIVILSNIEEFKLAQKAMALGVSGYILKLTMTWDEMNEVLKNVYEEIEQQYEVYFEKLETKTHLLKTEVFSEYFSNQMSSINCIEEIVQTHKLRLNQRKLMLCIMETDKYSDISEPTDENQLSVHPTIVNLINEILDGYNRGEVIHYFQNRYVILFSCSDLDKSNNITEEISHILGHIKRLMTAYLNLSVTFAISTVQDGYEYVRDQYQECNSSLAEKFFIGYGAYIFAADQKEDNYVLYIQPSLTKIVEKFKELFGEENGKEFEKCIVESNYCYCKSSLDTKRAFIALLQLPLSVMKIIRQDIFLLQVNYVDKIKECETINEIVNQYSSYLIGISKIIGRRTVYSREVLLALQYIKENYQNNISLQQVADHANLSMNYLSTVFKNETGINFVEYLSDYRIEKAKEMLLNSDLKLYEISRLVGYKDVSYFSRVFKKTIGYPPNEFKRKFLI